MLGSGTASANMTSISGGLVGNTAIIGIGNVLNGSTINSNTIDLSSQTANVSVPIARNATLTAISASLTLTVALNLSGSTVNVIGQIYTNGGSGQVFTAITGAAVALTPSLTGTELSGTYMSGLTTGLSTSVLAGNSLIYVFSITSSGTSLVNTVQGNINGMLCLS